MSIQPLPSRSGKRISGHRSQSGMSLMVVLMMLIIIAVLGVGAASLSLVNERSARNDRDSEVAFQAAEAALMDAEIDITGPNTNSAQRLCSFSDKDNISAFVPGCGGAGGSQGLCTASASGTAPAWLQIDFSVTDSSAKSVALGTFTGQTYMKAPTGGGSASTARLPRYVIEAIPDNGGYEADQLASASSGKKRFLYRVTAIGYGVRDETQIVLQSTVRKFVASPGCP
ncbi:type IV pilus assembly protein PilX [Variovorax boronicumulans]|uniref:pilus assembly PilX family protein n=1 Tax=Variovorax boronicumulans TaxID=436515 RepID=UPI002788BC8A|nr:PilX N-terminal domain-containing pilus assembly protein [Variovorax boronicumulans]MDQ0081489.1 type IV pilus assembly protein PilX [Variovorax boronicumulans]